MDAITTETVRAWHKELERLRDEVARLNKKIEAAAVLGLTVEEPSDPAALLESESSLPDLILAAMRERGVPLRPPEVKKLLLDAGMPESRFGKNGSYFYSSLMRLAKRGLIQKRGKRYSVVQ
jgi:hypothetical protein